MTMFEFSVIASGLDHEADDFEALFYDAGCDDALVSFQRGHVIVDFAREAGSIEDAIASAVEDVRATGAIVGRVEPDPLVSLSDIAARANVTRAAVTNYAKGQRGKNFPAPVAKVTTDSPLWNWSDVATWLFASQRLSREAAVEAIAVQAANDAIEAGEVDFRERLTHRVRERRVAL